MGIFDIYTVTYHLLDLYMYALLNNYFILYNI